MGGIKRRVTKGRGEGGREIPLEEEDDRRLDGRTSWVRGARERGLWDKEGNEKEQEGNKKRHTYSLMMVVPSARRSTLIPIRVGITAGVGSAITSMPWTPSMTAVRAVRMDVVFIVLEVCIHFPEKRRKVSCDFFTCFLCSGVQFLLD